MIASLADLLHPHDPGLLLAAAAGSRRLLLRTDRADAFARLLPWERLNDLITPDRVLAGEIEFARNHAILPAEMTIARPRRQKPPTGMRAQAVDQYARQGVSIVINGIHRLDPGISWMNAIIEREFRADIHTNVYASFGRDSAFKPHWDEHNVLVLHLQGRKRWRSWGQPWPAPRRRSEFPVADDPGTPAWEAVLEPGDVLYLPRGEIHAAAVIDGEDSLHLTVGITPPRIDALAAALARACEAEAMGRQDLPVLAGPADRDAWMAGTKALMHRAVDMLDLDQVLASLDQIREPLPAGALGLSRRLVAETMVMSALPRRLPLPAADQGPAVTLRAGEREWTIGAAERAVLDLVQRHHARSLAQLLASLPETGEEKVLQAIRDLAGKGLVRLRNGSAVTIPASPASGT